MVFNFKVDGDQYRKAFPLDLNILLKVQKTAA